MYVSELNCTRCVFPSYPLIHLFSNIFLAVEAPELHFIVVHDEANWG